MTPQSRLSPQRADGTAVIDLNLMRFEKTFNTYKYERNFIYE